MEKEFIGYNEALALKELGFDEPCFGEYRQWDGNEPWLQLYQDLDGCSTDPADYEYTLEAKAPTFSQAFKWFREKYDLDVTFRKMDYGPGSQFTGYYFSVYRGNELIDIHGADKKCKVYEDSELECLKKLIEIVKEK